MRLQWREAFQNRRFLFSFLISLAGLLIFAGYLSYFFNFILLPKPGTQLSDPVLNMFSPKDWSIEIFVLIYLCPILFLTSNISKPKIILLLLQSYVVVNFMRIASLYLFTLEAPNGIIPLTDPFLAVFAYGQSVYVKDLFFSGHISTLFILFIKKEKRLLKWFIFGATLIVGILLAWQRVHYTIDMAGAVLFSYLVVQFFRTINKRLITDKSL